MPDPTRHLPTEDPDVRRKLLHTSDWHLGISFERIESHHRNTFSQQRLQVVTDILALAGAHLVDAVVVCGDVFDERNPPAAWWQGLASRLSAMTHQCPVVLLPGNHDPLSSADSVFHPHHPFREALPEWVHVVDRDDWTLDVADDLRLYARPLRSAAGGEDPVSTLPARTAADDERFRVALGHGLTRQFGPQPPPFFVDPDAGARLGFDYVALGDFHGWELVRDASPGDGRGMTVYSGTPEPMRFAEEGAGNVVLVHLRGAGKPPRARTLEVGRYRWLRKTCASLDELRTLADGEDLARTVLRLTLEMTITLDEHEEVMRLLQTLRGTETEVARAALLEGVDERGLTFVPDAFDEPLPADVPESLHTVHARLRELLDDPDEADTARAALLHLHRLVHRPRSEASS